MLAYLKSLFLFTMKQTRQFPTMTKTTSTESTVVKATAAVSETVLMDMFNAWRRVVVSHAIHLWKQTNAERTGYDIVKAFNLFSKIKLHY